MDLWNPYWVPKAILGNIEETWMERKIQANINRWHWLSLHISADCCNIIPYLIFHAQHPTKQMPQDPEDLSKAIKIEWWPLIFQPEENHLSGAFWRLYINRVINRSITHCEGDLCHIKATGHWAPGPASSHYSEATPSGERGVVSSKEDTESGEISHVAGAKADAMIQISQTLPDWAQRDRILRHPSMWTANWTHLNATGIWISIRCVNPRAKSTQTHTTQVPGVDCRGCTVVFS